MPYRFKAARFWVLVTALSLTAAAISAGSATIGHDTSTIDPIRTHSGAI
ncbi:hypothetical protein JI664_14595 [Rhodobacter sp. NTK016B]|nr:hypothetical protein [Rhodobacter sp. NTK016B]MBN8293201.1 hypothetical protein [Rhodobacter sp. NTK016B]